MGLNVPGSAASLGSSALGSGKVKGPVEHNDAVLGIAEVRDQLGGGLGVDGAGVATASDTLGEPVGGTGDGGGGVSQHRKGGGEKNGSPHGAEGDELKMKRTEWKIG